MNLSRQAAFAAASLLSAIIAMPPAVLADDQPQSKGDGGDKDKKHKDHHENGGGDKKAPPQAKSRGGEERHGGGQPRAERPTSGFGKQPTPQQKGGFGQLNRPNNRAAGPNDGKSDTAKERSKSPASNSAPKTSTTRPPVINAAPKNPEPPQRNFSKDRAPDKSRAEEQGKHDQKHFGDKNTLPPAGGRPAVVNPSTNNPAGDANKHEQRHVGDKDKTPGNRDKTPAPGGKPAVVNPTNNPADRDHRPKSGFGETTQRGRPQPAKPLPAADARKRFDNLRKNRTEKTEGGKVFIKEGDRTIIKQNNRYVIQHDETERLRRVDPHARFEKGKNGMNIAVIERPGNVRIYSETDASGHLVRRYRRGPDGRDVIIIDNRRRRHGGGVGRDIATGIGIGVGVAAGAAILNSVLDVPPPRVRIPRERYIVDYDGASDEDVYDALSAPPVEDFRDRYTLDEIRATATLRDRMRRVDLDDINFEFGSWEVDPSEYNKLDRVARAMKRVIHRNPNEVFMIEGYTDAVGSQEDNLSLSDRRAESVAEVLSEEFQVPFENLVTQGYGEDYLKVDTDQPERLNRRVAVRRITPLLARGDGPPPPPRPNDRPPPQQDDRYAPADDRSSAPDNGPPEEHYEQVPGGDDPD